MKLKTLTFLALALIFWGITNIQTNTKPSLNKQTIPPTLAPKNVLPATDNTHTTNNIQKENAFVTRVVDGDTIKVFLNGKNETVRLIGIDTPETVDPRRPVQCFGKEASNKTKSVLDKKNIFLEADPSQGNRDKYHRLLRYVFLSDGTNFNKLLIEEGFAHEYTYFLPYKYQAEFKLAEKQARENKKGLWADNACSNNP